MKRLLLILLFAVGVGIATYFLSFGQMMKPVRQISQSSQPDLAWLTNEFHLTPDQTRRIGQLQSAYEPRCAVMCQQISENRGQVDQLISRNRQTSVELDSLLQTSSRLQMQCRQSMLAHIYEVAAVMPPDQASRYVGLMKMQVLEPGLPHPLTADNRLHE